MNYNYLIALFNWKRDSKPKGNSAIICIKLILTLLGIIMTFVFLWKIYEVPIYHTNICIRHNTDSIDISIKLVRDFDLHNHISKDTTSSKWKHGTHTGYLTFNGFAYTYDKDSLKQKSHNNMSHSLESGLRTTLNKQLQDSGAYHFIDNVKNIVFIQMSGTQRQFFRFINHVSKPSLTYNEGCYVIHHGDTLRQHWYCHYSNINPNTPRGTFTINDVYTSGIKDDSTFFEGVYYNSTFDKPNFFMTAEDHSKMIEEIHLENLDAKDIHKLDIDYKGAAEFGILLPQPDSMTISSIHYHTSEKINQIAKNGLKYQVRFTELENMQEIRIFFATMVLAGLWGIFFNLLYRLLRPLFSQIWATKSDNIISITIVTSLILLAIIVYFIFISRSASTIHDSKESKPLTELSIKDS